METLSTPELAVLLAFIAFAALLYSSVGHGGASGYLAAMALLGLAPAFGSELARRRLALRRVLGVVLVIAGTKLLMTA